MSNQWFGLDKDGNEIMISHEKLMDWAFDHNLQITVGWSHAVEIMGSRLVRGPMMISTAKNKGWNDLAEKLAEFGIEDGNTNGGVE